MEARLGFCFQWLENRRKYKSRERNAFTSIIFSLFLTLTSIYLNLLLLPHWRRQTLNKKANGSKTQFLLPKAFYLWKCLAKYGMEGELTLTSKKWQCWLSPPQHPALSPVAFFIPWKKENHHLALTQWPPSDPAGEQMTPNHQCLRWR